MSDRRGASEAIADVVRGIEPVLRHDLEARFAETRPNPLALPAMASAGLLGLTLPPRYGGGGQDYHALATAAEALARIDLAYQIALTVHLALSAMSVLQWGTAAQRDRWLPALARGERIATFGLTEPGAGSDVAAIRMRAVRDGANYRLDGEKTWISNANDASLFLLFATVDPSLRHRGITTFIVPRERAGLSTTTLTGKLGVRAGDTGSVVCDGVQVASAEVLGNPGEGFAIALSALATGLFTVGAGALGVAAECLRLTVELLREPGDRGIPVGREGWVQARVAKMVAGEARSRLLLGHAADLKNRGLPSQRATSLAKWVAADAARDAAETALAIHQHAAPWPHPTVERHLRNVRGSVIYGGTAEIHQTMQAAFALGDRVERPTRRPMPTAADLAGTSALPEGENGQIGRPPAGT